MLDDMRVGEVTDGAGDVPALFAAVAAIGPFFAVATGPEPPAGGWVSVRSLGRSGDDDPIAARIAAVRDALGTDARVAASTAFQGLAAQLVAPLFAAFVIGGGLPVPAGHLTDGLADVLHWRPGGLGPWLWWPGTGGTVAPCSDEELGDVLLGLLAPPAAAVRARVRVADRVLSSNVASAVASARRLLAAARPDLALRATAVAERILTVPALTGAAQLLPPEAPDLRWTFRRRSCCLYYRVPGGGICGDCVLQDRAHRGA
jgi:FhuF 2Fe-2S C-terminal domain